MPLCQLVACLADIAWRTGTPAYMNAHHTSCDMRLVPGRSHKDRAGKVNHYLQVPPKQWVMVAVTASCGCFVAVATPLNAMCNTCVTGMGASLCPCHFRCSARVAFEAHWGKFGCHPEDPVAELSLSMNNVEHGIPVLWDTAPHGLYLWIGLVEANHVASLLHTGLGPRHTRHCLWTVCTYSPCTQAVRPALL